MYVKLDHIIVMFLVLLCFPITAQTYKIKGHVYGQQNQEPIEDVYVQMVDHEKNATITNENGYFELETDQLEGELWLYLVGYTSQTIHYDVNQPPLLVQLVANSQILNEVKVTAFGRNKTIKETSGGVAYLSGEQLKQGSGVSMQQALNRVPGVRMDQSNLGDSRVSIRGNGVRSPWGMRNIKVYINGIPVTETDGTTRIEALDVPSLGEAEVIKGPASSIYGAGTGGVIKFQLERSPYQEQSIEASGLVGSYGLHREQITYRSGGDKLNSYVSYGHQELSGYREHSNDKRDFLTANFQFFPSEKQKITLLISRTSQKTQIPGALTEDQVKEDPRQAAVGNLAKDAGRMQNWTRIGLGQKYRFNKMLTNQTSVFTYFYDLHHPLVFGVIRNFYQSYGGRTAFDFDPHFKILPTVFTVGGEFNQALTKGSVYVNNQGMEGNMMSNTDYKNTMFTLFLQIETQLWKIANLELGVSYNGLDYQVTDYFNPEDGGKKRFKPQASPRIALSHNFGEWLSLHASVSYGFSNPTTTEIQNADQSLNKTIQAVEGINYELDAKGHLFKSRFDYSLSFYDMEMKGELIAQTISPGVSVYHNSGKTSHKGIELGLSYQVLKKEESKAFTKLNPYLSLTYSDFLVTDYKVLNAQNEVIANYDGNRLIGVAPWVVSAGVDFSTKIGFYGNVIYYFSDQYPLNDRNTDYNSAYSDLNAKLGYKIKLGKHFGLDVFVGMKNITDSQYSSFTALNATSYGGQPPAYFNPSPGRNWYTGLKIKYLFNVKNK